MNPGVVLRQSLASRSEAEASRCFLDGNRHRRNRRTMRARLAEPRVHVQEARSCPNLEHLGVQVLRVVLEADIAFAAAVGCPEQSKVLEDHLARLGGMAHCPLVAAVACLPYPCQVEVRCLAWSCSATVVHNHRCIHHLENHHNQDLVVVLVEGELAVHLFDCPRTVCRHTHRPSSVFSDRVLCLLAEARFVVSVEVVRRLLDRLGHSYSYSPFQLVSDSLHPSRSGVIDRAYWGMGCRSFALEG